MANISNLSSFLTDVADAIREKKGTQNQIPAKNFDTEIKSIETGTKINNQDKDITKNGTYTADEGYTGLGTVVVNVPQTGDVPVKLFKTKEEMNNSTGNKEGDLAVVYREEIQPVTEESEFDSCIFPNTVVLKEAFTGNIYSGFRAVDSSSGRFDGDVDMSSSRFRFNGFGDSGKIRVQYESQDGITYTRTDGGEELQEFGTMIKWEPYEDEEFNNVIGNFMKIKGNYFEGLYEYGPFVRNIVAFNTENIDVTTSPYINVTNTNIKVEVDTLDKCCKAVRRYLCGGDNYIFQGDFYLTSDLQNIIYVGNYSLTYSDRYVSIEQLFMNITNNKIYLPVSSNRSDLRDTDNKILNYNIENETITELTLQGDTTFVDANNNSYSCKEFNGYFLAANSYRLYTIDWITDNANVYNYLNWENNNSKKVQLKEINTSIYAPAKTQLDTTPDYVYEKTFYGKNGVENGTLGTPNNSFADTNAEVYNKIQNQYENMEPRILTDDDKTIAKNIYCIPVKRDRTPLLDTSKVTNMYAMFSNCSSLTTIPELNTSKVTDMSWMFFNCKNLTTISLLDTGNVTDMPNMFNGCSNLTAIPLLNTGNVTDMPSMFANCTNLTTIPLLDTSNVTDMEYMFYDCSSLNNESLNNILAMCANAAKITSNKTLKYISLTEEQANKCKTLSNYSAFTSAGWTTGY